MIKKGDLANLEHYISEHFPFKTEIIDSKLPSEAYDFFNGEMFDTQNWNVLQYAIAHKRVDIVRYFLTNLKMSLKQFGKRPEEVYKLTTMTEVNDVDIYLFPLQLAVNNTDDAML